MNRKQLNNNKNIYTDAMDMQRFCQGVDNFNKIKQENMNWKCNLK